MLSIYTAGCFSHLPWYTQANQTMISIRLLSLTTRYRVLEAGEFDKFERKVPLL